MFQTPYENAKYNLEAQKQEWEKDFAMSHPVKTCKRCLTTLDSFLNSGFVGCSECYNTFYSYLREFALDVHGRSAHTGKIPSKELSKASKKREAMKLLELEKEAVANSDYLLADEYKKKRVQLMEEIR